MKRFVPAIALISLLCVFAAPLWAATQPTSAASDRSPAAPIVNAVATVTGIAISPLLGTGAYGAYKYLRTPSEQRGNLPWYAQMSFWGPALLLVGGVALKDALGATLPPGWKKPLDILETLENKVSGLVAAGAVVPITMIGMTELLAGTGSATPMAGDPGLLAASGLATMSLGAIDGSSLLSVVMVPFGLFVFVTVWMASHAINVLILLSPWGAVDAALKSARTGVLGLVTLSATVDPWIGALCSGLVILFSYFVAGWAFRLTVFGSVFCWDIFTFRSGRCRVREEGNVLFSAGKLADVPPRTRGRLLKQSDGSLLFRYRPWLVMPPKEAVVPKPTSLWVGRGMFFSYIENDEGGVLLLPPRYRGHEEEMVQCYGLAGVRDAGLRRAWSWIRETLGFGPKVPVAGTA